MLPGKLACQFTSPCVLTGVSSTDSLFPEITHNLALVFILAHLVLILQSFKLQHMCYDFEVLLISIFVTSADLMT